MKGSEKAESRSIPAAICSGISCQTESVETDALHGAATIRLDETEPESQSRQARIARRRSARARVGLERVYYFVVDGTVKILRDFFAVR
jgi:hypothetical protein